MIRIHCDQVCDFVRVYVFDWHVLSALAVPLLFSALFPVYWIIICPEIWQRHPHLYDPRSWLISYWLFASLIWIIFLGICFFRTKAGDARVNMPNCHKTSSQSTEDLWNEDQYLPDPSCLKSPDYAVSVDCVQPEARAEMDETWEYDYEEAKEFVGASASATKALGYFEGKNSRRGTKSVDHSKTSAKKKPKQDELWRKFSEPPPDTGAAGFFRRNLLAGGGGACSSTSCNTSSAASDHEKQTSRHKKSKRGISFGRGAKSKGAEEEDATAAAVPPRIPSPTPSRRMMTRADAPMTTAPGRRGPHPLPPPPPPSSSSGARARLPQPKSQPPFLRKSSSGRHGSRANMTASRFYSGQTSSDDSSVNSNSGNRNSGVAAPIASYPKLPPPPPSLGSRPSLPVRASTLPTIRDRARKTNALTRSPSRASTKSDSSATAKAEAIRQRTDLTDEELNSLQDVCDGKIARRDSLVSDAKFDLILSSLQTLASNLSKDFDGEETEAEGEDANSAAQKPPN